MRRLRTNIWPLSVAEHDNRYLACAQVLLISHVLISRYENIVPSLLSCGQKIAVLQSAQSGLNEVVTLWFRIPLASGLGVPWSNKTFTSRLEPFED